MDRLTRDVDAFIAAEPGNPPGDEEVSLCGPTGVSPEFRRAHPASVFGVTSTTDRDRQRTTAGLDVAERVDLAAWSAQLLHDRRKAAALFRGTLDLVYSERERALIDDLLIVAQQEIESGRLRPEPVTLRPA